MGTSYTVVVSGKDRKSSAPFNKTVPALTEGVGVAGMLDCRVFSTI